MSRIIPYFNAKVESIQRPSGERMFALRFTNQKMLQPYLSSLSGKTVQVSIGKPKKIRSENQNDYYWGVVVSLISEYTGMSPDETHEVLKFKFLRRRKVIKRGNKIVSYLDTAKSTAGLGTGEFEAYLSEVKMFAASDLGIVIPNPNEVEVRA